MTHRETEDIFTQEVGTAIDNASANGLAPHAIASELRALASDVSLAAELVAASMEGANEDK